MYWRKHTIHSLQKVEFSEDSKISLKELGFKKEQKINFKTVFYLTAVTNQNHSISKYYLENEFFFSKNINKAFYYYKKILIRLSLILV